MELNILAVVMAAISGLVLSGAWYAQLGGQLGALHEAYRDDAVPRGAAATLGVELTRNLTVALVVAGLVDLTDAGRLAAVGLGLSLWLAFPVVLLGGSVFHERVPVRLAAIHGGDWLLKILAMALILGVWR